MELEQRQPFMDQQVLQSQVTAYMYQNTLEVVLEGLLLPLKWSPHWLEMDQVVLAMPQEQLPHSLQLPRSHMAQMDSCIWRIPML